MGWNDEREDVVQKALSNLHHIANNKYLHQTGIKVKNPLLSARDTIIPENINNKKVRKNGTVERNKTQKYLRGHELFDLRADFTFKNRIQSKLSNDREDLIINGLANSQSNRGVTLILQVSGG